MINNIYSLLNGKYFIDSAYANAQLPLLLSAVKGKVNSTTVTKLDFKQAVNATANNTLPEQSFIALVDLKQPIVKYSQFCGPTGTQAIMSRMDAYLQDDACVGVLLDIDSGGGQVSGTAEFFDYLQNYTKPVVAYSDGAICSAAYYIAAATDYIIGNPRLDCVGSIGVMVSFIDTSGIVAKQGGKVITEYADLSPDKNKAFENLLKGDASLYITEELNPIAETFIADMKKARPGIAEECFTGKTYNATDSLALGLIDEIGSKSLAFNKIINLHNQQNPPTTMKKPFKHLDAVLESPGFEDVQNVYLQEFQLDQIEAHLEQQNQQITTAQQTIDSLQASAQSMETLINDACVTHEVEGHATMTTLEKTTALFGLITEYGALDGATKTNAITTGDNIDPTEQWLASLPHNQKANQLLNPTKP